MDIRIFDHNNTNENELESLLSLFCNSSMNEDYTSVGEIGDMDTLKKVLSKPNLIHFFGYQENIPVAYCQRNGDRDNIYRESVV